MPSRRKKTPQRGPSRHDPGESAHASGDELAVRVMLVLIKHILPNPSEPVPPLTWPALEQFGETCTEDEASTIIDAGLYQAVFDHVLDPIRHPPQAVNPNGTPIWCEPVIGIASFILKINDRFSNASLMPPHRQMDPLWPVIAYHQGLSSSDSDDRSTALHVALQAWMVVYMKNVPDDDSLDDSLDLVFLLLVRLWITANSTLPANVLETLSECVFDILTRTSEFPSAIEEAQRFGFYAEDVLNATERHLSRDDSNPSLRLIVSSVFQIVVSNFLMLEMPRGVPITPAMDGCLTYYFGSHLDTLLDLPSPNFSLSPRGQLHSWRDYSSQYEQAISHWLSCFTIVVRSLLQHRVAASFDKVFPKAFPLIAKLFEIWLRSQVMPLSVVLDQCTRVLPGFLYIGYIVRPELAPNFRIIAAEQLALAKWTCTVPINLPWLQTSTSDSANKEHEEAKTSIVARLQKFVEQLAPSPDTHCAAVECDITGNDLKRCMGCKSARYCSVQCQRGDWRAHRLTCGKERSYI